MELRGRTAIVTGSGSGIGRALAVEFARQGANVVCCARRADRIEQTVQIVEKAGGTGLAVATDITRGDQVDNMVRKTLDHFGQIDVLFNNAGSFNAFGGLWEVDPDKWWHDVTVNLRGAMLCCRAVLGDMIKRNEGIIINMGGGGAGKSLPGGSAYACSKAALYRLTENLAREVERQGYSSIFIFGMGPGFVRTEMTELHASDQAARKWIPSTSDALDEGRDRSADDCASASVQLIKIACPQLNGRLFNADTDFKQIAAQADQIQADDLYVMRYKP